MSKLIKQCDDIAARIKPPRKLVIKRKGWSNLVCSASKENGTWIAELYTDRKDGCSSGFMDIFSSEDSLKIACWLVDFHCFQGRLKTSNKK